MKSFGGLCFRQILSLVPKLFAALLFLATSSIQAAEPRLSGWSAQDAKSGIWRAGAFNGNDPYWANGKTLAEANAAVLYSARVGISDASNITLTSDSGPQTFTEWKGIATPTNSLELKFSAIAKSDLHVWLRYAPNRFVQIAIGGWTNTQSCVRDFSGNDVFVDNNIVRNTATGNGAIIPNTQIPVEYKLTIVPDASGNGVLTVVGTPRGGAEVKILSFTSPILNQRFDAYLFRTWPPFTMVVGAESLMTNAFVPGALKNITITNFDKGFGWVNFPTPGNTQTLSFSALTPSADLYIGLKSGNDVIKIILGGWGNTFSQINGLDVKPDAVPGFTAVVPDTKNVVQYVLKLTPEAGTGKTTLTLVGKTSAGASVNILSHKADFFNRNFSSYSFTTYQHPVKVGDIVAGSSAVPTGPVRLLTAVSLTSEAGPTTFTEWKPIATPSNNLECTFKAVAKSDLHLWLRYGMNQAIQICVGGWTNTQSCIRDYNGNTVLSDNIIVANASTGNTAIIPDTANPVTYTVKIVPDAATGDGLLTVVGVTAAGASSNILTFRSKILNELFRGYLFRTWPPYTMQVGSDSVTTSAPTATAPAPAVEMKNITSTAFDSGAAGTFFGWKNFSAPSDNITLSFTALTPSADLYLGLKSGNDVVRVILGGWTNSFSQIAELTGQKRAEEVKPAAMPGYLAAIPDTGNPVEYTVTLVPDGTSGKSLLRVAGKTKNGPTVKMIFYKSVILNKQFSAYSFTTWQDPVKVGGDSAQVNVAALPELKEIRLTSEPGLPTFTEWTAIPSPSNDLTLTFSAQVKSDLHVWLKYGNNQAIQLGIGGWANTQSCIRDYIGTKAIFDEIIKPNQATGNTAIIPDTANPVSYTVRIVPDAATGNALLTLKGLTIEGKSFDILTFKSPVLNKVFSGYLFRTWPPYVLEVGRDVAKTGTPVAMATASKVTLKEITSQEYAAGAAGTFFGWKPLPAASNNLKLAFTAKKANDLFFAFKCGNNFAEVVLGGWENTHSHFIHNVNGVNQEALWLSGENVKDCTVVPGYANIVPDGTNPVDYVVTIAPEAGTNKGIMTVTAKRQDGTVIDLFKHKSESLTQKFTDYSLKAWNGSLRVGNDSALDLDKYVPANFFGSATTKIDKLKKLDEAMGATLSSGGGRNELFEFVGEKYAVLLKSVLGRADAQEYALLSSDEKDEAAIITGRLLAMQVQYPSMTKVLGSLLINWGHYTSPGVPASDRLKALYPTTKGLLRTLNASENTSYGPVVSVLREVFNKALPAGGYKDLSGADREIARAFLGLLKQLKIKEPALDLSAFPTDIPPCLMKINNMYLVSAGSVDEPVWKFSSSAATATQFVLTADLIQSGNVGIFVQESPDVKYPLIALSVEEARTMGQDSVLRLGIVGAQGTDFTYQASSVASEAGNTSQQYSLSAPGLALFCDARDPQSVSIIARPAGTAAPEGYAPVVVSFAPVSGASSTAPASTSTPAPAAAPAPAPVTVAFVERSRNQILDKTREQGLLVAHVDFLLEKMSDVVQSPNATEFDIQRFERSSDLLTAYYDALLPRQKSKLIACLKI